MRYNTMGRTGLQVSQLCVGMMSYGTPDWQKWVLDYESAEHFVKRALDAGINFFDTADFYSHGLSEEFLGKAIAKLTDRRSVALTSKVGLPMSSNPNDCGLSRKHIMESIDRSLKRLNTDYLDVYFLHQPDSTTPIEETVDAMLDLVKAGKVLYAGISNLPQWMTSKAVYYAKYKGGRKLGCVQLQYNLCYREDERDMLPLCAHEGIGVMAYSPLARGWLAGNRSNDAPMSKSEKLRAVSDAKAQELYGDAGDRAVVDQVLSLANERGVPPARIAMAWVLSNPAISSMICGILEDSHLDEALSAADLQLSASELNALNACYQPRQPKGLGLGAVMQSGESN